MKGPVSRFEGGLHAQGRTRRARHGQLPQISRNLWVICSFVVLEPQSRVPTVACTTATARASMPPRGCLARPSKFENFDRRETGGLRGVTIPSPSVAGPEGTSKEQAWGVLENALIWQHDHYVLAVWLACGFIAVVAWGFGRICRYVLAGTSGR
jgi:hypothetical protein